MSAISSVQYTAAQRREAADWFVLIRDEVDPKVETLQAWLRWMEAADGNRLAFEAMARVWRSTPDSLSAAMPTAEDLRSDRYDGDLPVDHWLSAQAVPAITRRKPAGLNPTNHYNKRWTWAAVASIAAIAAGLIAASRFPGTPTSLAQELATKTGEQIDFTLADGSHVWLGAKSRLRIGFTTERRGILLESGEAFFAVKKDSTRPFVVRALDGEVTAVGTAFDVRAVADTLTVAVSEGVVSVGAESQVASPNRAVVRVASGQQLTIESHNRTHSLTVSQSANSGERSRWREGVLVYRNETLRAVVADVARYTTRRIDIADDATGDLRFSGIINASGVDEWATALPESFPVMLASAEGSLTIKARGASLSLPSAP